MPVLVKENLQANLKVHDVTKVLGAVMPMSPTYIVFGSTALDANLDGDEVVYSLMVESNKASIRQPYVTL